MSKWSETNERLYQKKVRSRWAMRKERKQSPGYKVGTEKKVVRRGREAIVPLHRSAYSPKPGEAIGPAKPGRNTGQVRAL